MYVCKQPPFLEVKCACALPLRHGGGIKQERGRKDQVCLPCGVRALICSTGQRSFVCVRVFINVCKKKETYMCACVCKTWLVFWGSSVHSSKGTSTYGKRGEERRRRGRKWRNLGAWTTSSNRHNQQSKARIRRQNGEEKGQHYIDRCLASLLTYGTTHTCTGDLSRPHPHCYPRHQTTPDMEK